MHPRKREVTDMAEVLGILARCTTVRLGISGKDRPYVVPISFGMEAADGKARIYFHCGKKGLKVDLLKENPQVCIEGDIFHGYEAHEQGLVTRYESVVGFGTCEEVFDEEKRHGLELLCAHCGYADHPVDECLGLPITSVYRVTLDEITGKRTLPDYWGQANEI